MATEITEAPKPKIADSFRQAADPKNTSGRNPAKAATPPVEAPVAPAETAKAVPPVETAKPLETPLVADPDAGLKALVKPSDKETNMANLRQGKEAAEKRAAELETLLRETEGKIPKDYEQVLKDREDLMRVVESERIEKSPRFQEKYDKPIQTALSSIAKTLANTDADPNQIVAIINQPDSKERTKALAEALDGLDRISSGKIAAQLVNIDSLRDARASELSNPRETFSQQKQEQEKQSRVQKEQSNQIIEKTIEKFSQLPILKPIEGNEAWNAQVESVKANARNYWMAGHTVEDMAEVTMAGAMAPLLSKALDFAKAENDRLNAELEEFRAATPAMRAASAAPDKSGAAKPAGALAAFNKGAYGTENRPATSRG